VTNRKENNAISCLRLEASFDKMKKKNEFFWSTLNYGNHQWTIEKRMKKMDRKS
jgi:hypothetical protein